MKHGQGGISHARHKGGGDRRCTAAPDRRKGTPFRDAARPLERPQKSSRRQRRYPVNGIQRQTDPAAAEHARPRDGEDKGRAGIVAEGQQGFRLFPGDTAALVQLPDGPAAYRIAADDAQQKDRRLQRKVHLPQKVKKAAGDGKGYRHKKGKQRRDHRPAAQRQPLPHRLSHHRVFPQQHHHKGQQAAGKQPFFHIRPHLSHLEGVYASRPPGMTGQASFLRLAHMHQQR